MATEREVNIRLKADAKQAKELKVELKALTQEIKAVELGFKSNSITQKEASERFRDLAQRIKQTGANELELVDITQRLWHANNRVEIGFKSLASETIHANQALREIQKEQRLGNQLLGSMSSILGGGAAGLIGQFQKYEDAILTSSVAMRGFGSTAAMLSAAAGPLAAVGGIIAFTATTVSGLSEEIKKLDKQIQDSLIRQGKISKADQYKALQKELASVQAEEFSPSFAEGATAVLSGRGGRSVLLLAAQKFNDEKRLRIELLNEEITKLKESVKIQFEEVEVIGKAKKAELEIEKQITKEKEEQAKRVNEMFLRDRAAGFGSIERLSPDTDIAGTIRGQVKGAKAPDKLRGVEPFVAAKKEIGEFERVAIGSFSRVGLSLSSQLGRGFVDAFGIGHTVLGQFVEDFLSQMAQLAASKVLKGLFSLIPGVGGFLSEILPFAGGGMINEPVIGRGTRSGSIYTIAEKEPEMVVPSSRMGNVGAGSQIAKALNNFADAFNNGSWRQMNGRDLVYVTENATLIEKRRRY